MDFFFYKQQRYSEAIKVFLNIFSIEKDSSILSYSEVESVRLDDFLKEEIRLHKEISVKSIVMAHYWIIRCFAELSDDVKCQHYLGEFRRLVQEGPEPLYLRLLDYTKQFLAEKRHASAIQFWAQPTQEKTEDDLELEEAIRLSLEH